MVPFILSTISCIILLFVEYKAFILSFIRNYILRDDVQTHQNVHFDTQDPTLSYVSPFKNVLQHTVKPIYRDF